MFKEMFKKCFCLFLFTVNLPKYIYRNRLKILCFSVLSPTLPKTASAFQICFKRLYNTSFSSYLECAFINWQDLVKILTRTEVFKLI